MNLSSSFRVDVFCQNSTWWNPRLYSNVTMLALAGGIVAIEWYRMVWSELLFNPLVRFCPGFVYFKVYVKPNKLLLFAPFLSAKYAIGFFIGSRTAKIYWFCQKPWVDALLCSLPIHKGGRREELYELFVFFAIHQKWKRHHLGIGPADSWFLQKKFLPSPINSRATGWIICILVVM